jgi:hypothetical protein
VRESYIERETCKLLAQAGAVCVKVGVDGYPDRLILLGPGRHMWIEFKQPGGVLRPNQVLRIRQLQARGDLVNVLDAVPDKAFFSWITVACHPHSS